MIIILDLIEKGGMMMWPLILVAFLSILLIVIKAINVIPLYMRYQKTELVEKVRIQLQKQDYDHARFLILKKGPIEDILLKGMD